MIALSPEVVCCKQPVSLKNFAHHHRCHLFFVWLRCHSPHAAFGWLVKHVRNQMQIIVNKNDAKENKFCSNESAKLAKKHTCWQWCQPSTCQRLRKPHWISRSQGRFQFSSCFSVTPTSRSEHTATNANDSKMLARHERERHTNLLFHSNHACLLINFQANSSFFTLHYSLLNFSCGRWCRDINFKKQT